MDTPPAYGNWICPYWILNRATLSADESIVEGWLYQIFIVNPGKANGNITLKHYDLTGAYIETLSGSAVIGPESTYTFNAQLNSPLHFNKSGRLEVSCDQPIFPTGLLNYYVLSDNGDELPTTVNTYVPMQFYPFTPPNALRVGPPVPQLP